MCRVCFCELSKAELSKKCTYKRDNIDQDVPWNNNNLFVDYKPSTTLQPKINGLPVIINGQHLQSSEHRLLCPMYWSLIPPWFKDDLEEWTSSTYNARIENLYESQIYSKSLMEGKRCVVIMEGFYEFKKSNSQTPEVYYLHSPDNKLLKAAGLFSITKLTNGKTLYSCTIITNESTSNLKKLHHRMPLLLNNDSDVETWLNFKKFSPNDAVAQIKASHQGDLKFYKTSQIGSRELHDSKNVNLASKSIMSNWLKATTSSKGVKRKTAD